MSRKESKNEPSDGLRVVNALLTQIDQLKSYPNVLVLATSNLRNSIDDAFLDRADVSYDVGLPSESATYDILYSCLKELMDKGLVQPNANLFSYKLVTYYQSSGEKEVMGTSTRLLQIVRDMKQTSARCLRKLPFQALMEVKELPSRMEDYLDALGSACKAIE